MCVCVCECGWRRLALAEAWVNHCTAKQHPGYQLRPKTDRFNRQREMGKGDKKMAAKKTPKTRATRSRPIQSGDERRQSKGDVTTAKEGGNRGSMREAERRRRRQEAARVSSRSETESSSLSSSSERESVSPEEDTATECRQTESPEKAITTRSVETAADNKWEGEVARLQKIIRELAKAAS